MLLLPVSAPWLKVSECIDFGRDVGAPQSVAIHDKIYSEIGLAFIDGHLERMLGERGQTYTRLKEGDSLCPSAGSARRTRGRRDRPAPPS